MTWIYFDIETSPPDGTSPDWERVKAPSNYKDPAKIRQYQVEHAFPKWAEMALSVPLAKVTCLSACTDDSDVFHAANGNESRTMEQFAEWCAPHLHQHEPVVWCAFYGLKFDMPIVATRLLKYGLPQHDMALLDVAQRVMPRNRYGDQTHRDPLVALGGDGSQSHWAKCFGIPCTFADFERDDFHRQPFARIQQKNQEDVVVLRKLAQILRDGGML